MSTRRQALQALCLPAFAWGLPAGAQSSEPTRALVLSPKSQPSRPLKPWFLGFNGNLVAVDRPWSNDQLVQAFARLNPGNLRYPGGTVANYWDWERGGIDRQLKPGQMGESKGLLEHANTKGGYDVAALARAVKATGAMPIYVANMLKYDVEQQVLQLNKAKDLGLPITHIELGNEFYFGRGAHPSVVDRYPSAAAYARAVGQWARRLKQAFPGVQVSAVATGAGGDPSKSKRRTSWDEQLFPLLDNVDALSVHLYAGSGALLAPERRSGDSPSGFWADAETQKRQAAALRTPEGVADLVQQPRLLAERLLAPAHYPRGLALWISEYNVFERVGALRGTWAHGLAVASFVDYLLGVPSVELCCYHNLYSQLMFSAIWSQPRETRFSAVHGDEKVAAYDLTGAGLALAFLAHSLDGVRQVKAFQAHLPGEQAGGAERASPVSGWQLTTGDSTRWLLMNFGHEPITCTPAQAEGMAAPTRRASVSRTPGRLVSERPGFEYEPISAGQLVLPAYSLNTFV